MPRPRNLPRPLGFTFVETLAAMLFMAILIPVAMEGLLLANTVEVRASRKRMATELATRLLNETVVTQSWRDGDQEGDCGEDFPGYRWKRTSQSWTEDTMRLVTIEITYTVQSREFTERISTLADQLIESTGVTQ